MKTTSEYLEAFPEAFAAQQAAREGVAPLLDLTLHEYWAECQMLRQPPTTPWALTGDLRNNLIDQETFDSCQQVASDDRNIPFGLRQKLARLVRGKQA